MRGNLDWCSRVNIDIRAFILDDLQFIESAKEIIFEAIGRN
jgi:hypothetical protein